MGSEKTTKHVEELVSAGITSFFTDENHYSVRQSKYGERKKNVRIHNTIIKLKKNNRKATSPTGLLMLTLAFRPECRR